MVVGELGALSCAADLRVASGAAGPPKVAASPGADLLFKVDTSTLDCRRAWLSATEPRLDRTLLGIFAIGVSCTEFCRLGRQLAPF
mgnify:FL=1|jgi:hypothetical protein